MIVDCISDLHGFYPELEGGDLLIVAGDLTAKDEKDEYLDFGAWLSMQKYEKKILISGNHDNIFKKDPRFGMAPVGFEYVLRRLDTTIEYLCDSGTEFEELKIWGSPWTKTFEGMNSKCKAFTVDTEEELMDKFEKIPHDTDILITHSPPYGILDCVQNIMTGKSENVGSKSLYGWLKYVERPKIHVFGHIHEGYGIKEVFPTYDDEMMKSVNASIVNEYYKPVNKPIRVIL